MELPEKITQPDKDQFRNSWRMRYVEALKEQQKALEKCSMLDPNEDDSVAKKMLFVANCRVELLDLEKKIFYQIVVLKQQINRSNEEKTIVPQEAEEAKANIERVIETANSRIESLKQWMSDRAHRSLEDSSEEFRVSYKKAESEKAKIESLMTRWGTVNKHDNEQLITFYKSLKVELQKQNVPI